MSMLLVPEESQEVRELTQQVTNVEAAARELSVIDEVGLKQATDLLGWIAGAKKSLEEKRKMFAAPLNDHVKRINEFFKQRSTPLDNADSMLRGKVLGYRQEQARIRREEEERLRKLADKAQKQAEKMAVKEGIAAPPPPPIPFVPQQAKTVEGGFGAVSAKLFWDFQITDETKVPREFLMVNEKAIRAAVRAGVRNINGVTIFQTETLAVSAR